MDIKSKIHCFIGKIQQIKPFSISNVFSTNFHSFRIYSGMEALGKVRGDVARMGLSFLERLKELRDGAPIGEVAGKM